MEPVRPASDRSRPERITWPARAGRAGEWTLDDVEGARLMANEVGRPFGAACPHPDERWTQRRRPTDDERDFFMEDVARNVYTQWSQAGFTLSESEPGPAERASFDRAGIARTLVEHGLLQFKTRRVSPPITALISAAFS